MRYPPTPRPAKQTLASLRPNTTVICLQCLESKAAAGAVKFHAHHVCADCAAKLKLKAA